MKQSDGNGDANSWVARLTWSRPGGAFPEAVLEGNFGQVLPQFLCFLCRESGEDG